MATDQEKTVNLINKIMKLIKDEEPDVCLPALSASAAMIIYAYTGNSIEESDSYVETFKTQLISGIEYHQGNAVDMDKVLRSIDRA